MTIPALAVAIAASASCNGTASSSADLSFLVREYSITAPTHSVAPGKVTVAVENRGTVEHELVFFRSDLAATRLPLAKDGHRVDEEGIGLTHLDPEAENLAPGKKKEISIELTRGRYVVICNLPDHYGAGMHTVIEVR